MCAFKVEKDGRLLGVVTDNNACFTVHRSSPLKPPVNDAYPLDQISMVLLAIPDGVRIISTLPRIPDLIG